MLLFISFRKKPVYSSGFIGHTVAGTLTGLSGIFEAKQAEVAFTSKSKVTDDSFHKAM